jgi:hypothetical protein
VDLYLLCSVFLSVVLSQLLLLGNDFWVSQAKCTHMLVAAVSPQLYHLSLSLRASAEYQTVDNLNTLFNPLTPELNPSAQRCLTRFFTWDFAS